MDLSVPDAVLQAASADHSDALTPMDLSVPDAGDATISRPSRGNASSPTPAAPPISAGTRISVRVVQRQSSEIGHSFVVPGYVSTRSNAYAHCSGTERGSLYAMTDGEVTLGHLQRNYLRIVRQLGVVVRMKFEKNTPRRDAPTARKDKP